MKISWNMYCIIIIISSITYSCTSSKKTMIWGLSINEWDILKQSQNYKQLIIRPISDEQFPDILQLHEGAGYTLGRIMHSLTYEKMAHRLFTLQLATKSEPWREATYKFLLNQAHTQQKYIELFNIASIAHTLYPHNIHITAHYFTALLVQNNIDMFIKNALPYHNISETQLKTMSTAEQKHILYYSTLVSLITIQQNNTAISNMDIYWSIPNFKKLLFEYTLSAQELDILIRIMFAPEIQHHLLSTKKNSVQTHNTTNTILYALHSQNSTYSSNKELINFFETYNNNNTIAPIQYALYAKWLYSNYHTKDALTMFALFFKNYPHLATTTIEKILYEYYATYIQARLFTKGAQTLAHISETTQFNDIQKSQLFEYSGRLYRTIKNYSAAESMLRQSIRYAIHDKNLWVLLRIWSINDDLNDSSMHEFIKYSRMIQDPTYFTDVFERIIGTLMSTKKWSYIYQISHELQDILSPETQAHLQFILVELSREHFYTPPHNTKLKKYYKKSYTYIKKNGTNYYRLMATWRSKKKVTLSTIIYPTTQKILVNTMHNTLLEGYIYWNLLDTIYTFSRKNYKNIATKTLITASQIMYNNKNYFRTVMIIELIKNRIDFPLTKQTIQLLYPQAFLSEITPISQQNSLDLSYFYGLIRAESLYSPTIKSHVGAHGLTQLMPATAQMIAKKMQLTNINLNDSFTNLSIGGNFLNTLLTRYNAPVKALIGYNAGPSRVKKWQKKRPWTNMILFHEAIPFFETRQYIRKVIMTTIAYDIHYYNVKPSDTLTKFFSHPKTLN